MSDFLGMSDEDFLNQSPSAEGDMDSQVSEPEPEEQHEEVELSAEESGSEAEPEEAAVEEEDVEQEEDESEDTGSEEVEEASQSEPDFGDLERIKQAFKANGTEVQVKSVDEAISLMQMGANYTKKMQALQPNLKVLKTLEKHNLLEEDKLNYLIDLSKKDPKAISKLVSEAELDPMDIETDVEYTPNDHQVSDASVQLEQVLDDLKSTPTYSKCIDVVGNQWDEGSRNVLTREPALIAQINEQMQLGIFDKIQQEVERTRMFGGLAGMSDFDAYRQMGAQMYQAGQLGQPQQAAARPVAKTQPKQKDDALARKRKAAATPKTNKSPKAKKQDFNPLAMSDEEFLKLNNIHI